MRVAVIGGGWMGCHIASKLKDKHDVILYEQRDIFSQASMNNQNRLHLGYHYARNSATRKMCKDTFNKFKNDYSFLLSVVPYNIYAIPDRGSIIDFETYIKIFSDHDFEFADFSYLSNISGAINVKEEHINSIKAKSFFKKHLEDITIIKKVDSIKKLSMNHDLIINCTNNQFNPITKNSFDEPCKIFVYSKISSAPFNALTLVDGPLFSIFPLDIDNVTVSDVQFTPDSDIPESSRISSIEEKILYYYPNFHKNFKYNSTLNAIKAKPVDMSDNRTPVITMEDNVINCFSGKIQGIYYLEDYVRKICEF